MILMSRRFATEPNRRWHSYELRLVDNRTGSLRYEVIEIGPDGHKNVFWRTGVLDGAKRQLADRTETLLGMGYHWINKPYRIAYNEDGTASLVAPAIVEGDNN